MSFSILMRKNDQNTVSNLPIAERPGRLRPVTALAGTRSAENEESNFPSCELVEQNWGSCVLCQPG